MVDIFMVHAHEKPQKRLVLLFVYFLWRDLVRQGCELKGSSGISNMPEKS